MTKKSPLDYFDNGGNVGGVGPATLPIPQDVTKSLNYNPAGSNIGPKELQTPDIQQATSDYDQARLNYAKALEMRYAQPNWAQIAAGFLKPQLGGFFASLGSANEAYGQQLEAQRAVAPTIAELRMGIARARIEQAQRAAAQKELVSQKSTSGTSTPEATAKASMYTGEPVATTTTAASQSATTPVNIDTQKINRLESVLDGIYNRNGFVPPEMVKSLLDMANLTPDQFKMGTHKDISFYSNPANKGTTAPTGGVQSTPISAANLKPNAGNQQAPAQPITDGTIGGYLPLTFPKSDYSTMSKAEAATKLELDTKNASAIDAPLSHEYAQWSSIANSPEYAQGKNDYQEGLKILTNPANQNIVNHVLNVMRDNKGSILTQIAAGVNQGIGLHGGGLNFSLSAPIETMIRAGLNDDEQKVADDLAKILMRSSARSAYLNGFEPGKGQESYMDYLSGAAPNMNMNPAALTHILAKDAIKYNQFGKNYELFTQGLSKTNPNTHTPYSDVNRFYKPYLDSQKQYQDALDKHTKAYEDYLSTIANPKR